MKGHHSAVLCFKRERIVKSSFLLILFLFILSVIITPTYAKEKDMELRLVQVVNHYIIRQYNIASIIIAL